MMSFTGSTMLKYSLRVRGKRSFKDDLVEGARDPGRVAVLEDVSPESHPGRPRFHQGLDHSLVNEYSGGSSLSDGPDDRLRLLEASYGSHRQTVVHRYAEHLPVLSYPRKPHGLPKDQLRSPLALLLLLFFL